MPLRRALAYSLLAHGVLLTLWWLPAQFDLARGRPPAMQAMLLSAVSGKVEGARELLPARTAARPLPGPHAEAVASLPHAVQQVPAELAGGGTKSGSVSTASVGLAGESPQPSESAPVREARSGINAEGLRQYQYALARETQRHYHYPPLARERGWEGRVEVRIGVAPGQRPVVGLLHSSGHEILDQQALSMVGKALLAVALPDSLRGYSFSVPVPFEFSLKDD